MKRGGARPFHDERISEGRGTPSPRRFRGSMRTYGAAVILFLAQVAGGFAGEAGGEDYIIRTWQTEDGLPQNSVTAMVQTDDRYLWMGTFNGLVRFDGVQFRNFDTINTPALGSSRIIKLFKEQ